MTAVAEGLKLASGWNQPIALSSKTVGFNVCPAESSQHKSDEAKLH